MSGVLAVGLPSAKSSSQWDAKTSAWRNDPTPYWPIRSKEKTTKYSTCSSHYSANLDSHYTGWKIGGAPWKFKNQPAMFPVHLSPPPHPASCCLCTFFLYWRHCFNFPPVLWCCFEKPRRSGVWEEWRGDVGGEGGGLEQSVKTFSPLFSFLMYVIHYQNIFRNTFSVYIQYRRHTQQGTESIFLFLKSVNSDLWDPFTFCALSLYHVHCTMYM